MTNLAPIALFTFKKLEPLKQTINALKVNSLAINSHLYIYSDAASKENDKESVNAVRKFIKTITGFKTITIIEAESNRGLANSIIHGVSNILNDYDRVIVLEDDLISSNNFLSYMNNALNYYENYSNIFSIAGYSPPIEKPIEYNYDVYFTFRASSWGWGTWKKQWEVIDWRVSSYNKFKHDNTAKKKFNKMGSDMTSMLAKQIKGKSDSWAIRWCFHQFQNNLYTVFPIKSKINNIGFTETATHTNSKNNDKRFETPLDKEKKIQFSFSPNVTLNNVFIKQFIVPYSIKTRLHYKLKNIFGK